MRFLPRARAIPVLATLVLVLAAGVVVPVLAQVGLLPGLRAGRIPPIAYVAPGILVAAGLAATLLVRGRIGVGRRAEGAGPEPAPDSVAAAAARQARRAGEFVERVRDPARREELGKELQRIESAREDEVSTLDVVIFGTVSAGKTSLINALMGRKVGATEAVMGTTRAGETQTYELKSVEAVVRLTDTPGMSEAGEEGMGREALARGLAVRADLLLFVVDHDLVRSEYAPLIELARLGKRSIVVLNKKDRFPDEDLAAIRERLRQRLAGVIEPADIVAVAADPRPIPVRVQRPDGGFDTVLEPESPDIEPLRRRIAEVLRRDGRLLHATNLLVRGKVLEQEAQEQIDRERERQAEAVIERYQWITAGTVFANPVPALDVLAGSAVQLDMIADLGRVYGMELSMPQIRNLAGQMGQEILRLGLIETATSLIAGVFKRSFVGFAAGGAVQAATMGYLTRVAGRAFHDYFRRGRAWGPEGVKGVVLRQFQQTSRAEFLQDFASQVVHRVLQKLLPIPIPGSNTAVTGGKEPR
ncbi:tRNA modification GTPase MnmE [Aquisphaera giovannonii]|uniref:tRNA modification GTPase MnmE n=1 Tax=Aquisphaera giovannonii TaxID=406548 RepID=A0A5B9W6M9_9BACT|nr:GTP-binding protein [Aquisphaera giovannonii]QEH36263.1 tRNA modification GTPase MnmE [Aquisphaera giovannonii]